MLIRLFFCVIFLNFYGLSYSSEFYKDKYDESNLKFFKLDTSDLFFPEAILFDYDDTLVDSWPQALITFNTCLMELGFDAMEDSDQYKLPHIPDIDLLVNITGQPIDKVKKVYKEAYEKHHKEPAPLIEGVLDLLEYIKSKNIYLGLVSNKQNFLLRSALESLGLTKYFNKIVGAGDAEENKPSPKSVLYALRDEKNEVTPSSNVWFVGDSITDMKCALLSGLSPIWLSKKSTCQLTFISGGCGIYEVKSAHDLIKILKLKEIK